MKVLILAGGLGTRISEETSDKPKPMVLLGDRPILWHIMDTFARQGFHDFVIAGGYKADVIKRYFVDMAELGEDITVDLANGKYEKLSQPISKPWKVTILDTGLNTQTGGRIARVMRKYPRESFIVTYGDGLANVDVNELVSKHKANGKHATVTAVRPPARFGVIKSEFGLVTNFGEKSQTDVGWVNGGFFVLNSEVVKYIGGDDSVFELEPIQRLVSDGQLSVNEHYGFWQPMDTLRERNLLSRLASEPNAPWLIRD
jgi:glucose-1-phosphate cytidylyltransferase